MRPEDLSDAELQALLQARGLTSSMSPPPPPRPRMGALRAGALGALDGVSFGWADEAAGLINADWRESLRDQYAQANEDASGAFLAGQVGSAFVPGLGLFGAAGRIGRMGAQAVNAARNVGRARRGLPALSTAALMQRAPLGERVGYAMAAGATQGALTGAGTAEGGVGERTLGAVGGAAMGAGLGAAFPLGAAAARRVGNVAGVGWRNLRQSSLPIVGGAAPDTRRAEALMFDRLTTDLQSPAPMQPGQTRPRPVQDDPTEELRARLRRDRAVGGTPASVLDLAGENTSRLAEYAGAIPGPGRNAVRDEVGRRVTQQAGAVEKLIERRTGGRSFQETIDALDAEQRALAGPLYRRLDQYFLNPSTTVTLTEQSGARTQTNLGELLARPSVQRASRRAFQLARENGDDLRTLGLLEGGELTLRNGGINLRLLDWIKQGLDGEIQLAKNPMAGIDRNELGRMKRTAAQLTQVLDELVAQAGEPGLYARARNMYAGVARLKDAAELGRQVFRPGSHSEWLAEVSDFNVNEADRVALLAGLRDAMLERAYAASDGANLYRQLLGNKGVRQRIGAVFGPIGKNGALPPAAQKFFAQVRREAQRLVRVNEIYSRTNSQTGPRALEADANDEALADAMVNILTGNAAGGALQMARRFGKGLLGSAPMTAREAEYIVNQTIRPLRMRPQGKAGPAPMIDDAMDDPTARMDVEDLIARYRLWQGRDRGLKPYRALGAQAGARGAVGWTSAQPYETEPLGYY